MTQSSVDRIELVVVRGLIAIAVACIAAATALAAVCIVTDKPLGDATGIFVPLIGIGATAVGSLGTRRTRIDPTIPTTADLDAAVVDPVELSSSDPIVPTVTWPPGYDPDPLQRTR